MRNLAKSAVLAVVSLCLFTFGCGGGSGSGGGGIQVGTGSSPFSITSVSPNTGSAGGGTTVTITGVGFDTTATVFFGDVQATIQPPQTSTQIVVVTPTHAAGTVDVSVKNASATAVAKSAFTFATGLFIGSVTPQTGPTAGGTSVTITGGGFLPGLTLTFGGTAATNITVGSSTQITATTPAHVAGGVDVVVTNPGGETFTFKADPVALTGYLYLDPLQVLTTALAQATLGVAYSQPIQVTGGIPPYTFSITAGALPSGLRLNTDGSISGAATATGTFNFSVTVKDTLNNSVTAPLSVVVGNTLPGGKTAIVDCGILNVPGAIYVLQNDVTAAGTCFSIQADNIVLDLNGHTVTYAATDSANPHFGVLGIACFDPASTGNPCGGTQNSATVMNGTIVQGAAAAPFSHAFRLGQTAAKGGCCWVLHDLDITVSSKASVPIFFQFAQGGHSIFNNTIHDNATDIFDRHQLQGYALQINNEGSNNPGATKPNDIHHNTILSSSQGGIRDTNNNGSTIHDNDVTFMGLFTNDFCYEIGGANQEIFNNKCHPASGRGIHVSHSGASVHDNIIDINSRSQNAEYGFDIGTMTRAGGVVTAIPATLNFSEIAGSVVNVTGAADPSFNGTFTVTALQNFGKGLTWNQAGADALTTGGHVTACEVGGGYGIQVESDISVTGNEEIFNNNVTVHATECDAQALRMTNIASTSSISVHDNTFIAQKENLLGSPSPRLAHAIAADLSDGTSTAITANNFTSDTDGLFIDFDASKNMLVQNNSFTKGANAGTWFAIDFVGGNGGNSPNNTLLDNTYLNGADPTSNKLVVETDTQEYFLKWTWTLKAIDQNNAALAGATVTLTDAKGGVTTGITDAAGQFTTVLTQQHVFNSSTAITTDVFNPYSVAISKSGCTTDNFNLTIAATTTTPRTVSCP